MATRLSALPSVERVLSDPRIARLIESSSRDTVAGLVRERIAAARETALNGAELPSYDAIIVDIEHHSKSRWEQWPHSVINATGVILHTNLGRAPLSKESLDAIQAVAGSYTDLEFDLDEGKRGGRNTRVSSLLRQLSGAEAAFAVGNNAAAVTLGLASVAAGKQVIVSRGEAVEIGGGFRIPDVLRQSGAELVEVGTTNRTYARDYERAITGNTGAILTVHSSNFRVVGFVHAPTLAELVEIGRKRNVPVLHDLGSGCFLDTTRFGLAREPRPQDSIAAGVDMAFFSGDKLLGGPQAGIIAGKRAVVDAAMKHPLARAMRMDKLTMAALIATLLHYIRDEATDKIPVWRMIATPLDSLDARAKAWRKNIGKNSRVIDGRSAIGGGSLPGETLPSRVLAIESPDPDGLAARLRHAVPPVIGHIEDGLLLLDPRTVPPEQDGAFLNALASALS